MTPMATLARMSTVAPLPLLPKASGSGARNMLVSTRPILRQLSTSLPSARSYASQGPRLAGPSATMVARSRLPHVHLARAPLSTSVRLAYATPHSSVPPPPSPVAASSSSAPSSSASASSSTPPPEDPSPEPQPSSAYARFKLLSQKYGWYAAAMYLLIGGVDFTLSLLLIHAIGLEGIEPAVRPLIHQFHRLRYGEAEAVRMDEEAKKESEVHAREVQEAAATVGADIKGGAAAAGGGAAAGKKGGYLGSKVFWAEVSLAYVIHKTLLLPFRAGLVVAWTPKMVNWLTKRGWVGKGGLGRAASHAQDRLRERTGRIKGGAGGSD